MITFSFKIQIILYAECYFLSIKKLTSFDHFILQIQAIYKNEHHDNGFTYLENFEEKYKDFFTSYGCQSLPTNKENTSHKNESENFEIDIQQGATAVLIDLSESEA